MKLKHLVLMALSFPTLANACVGYVLGFRGLNAAFDAVAFTQYAEHVGFCGKVFNWEEINQAKAMIDNTNVPYQLYGYSKGAETVARLLKQPIRRPVYVITIGAYKTVDVDFSRYNIDNDNYFDASGIGQKSPGVFLNVPHYKMQQEVNKVLGCMQQHIMHGKPRVGGSTPPPSTLWINCPTRTPSRQGDGASGLIHNVEG